MPQQAIELNGKRIVVVEDDYLLAADICSELRELGATVLGPAPTPFYASQLISSHRIDAAVLDVRLHGATVFDVADELKNRGVPILFATGYDRSALPARFRDARLLTKPLDRKKLVSEIFEMTRRPVAKRVEPVELVAPAEAPKSTAEMFALALARTLPASSA